MCTLATEETSNWLMVDPWEAFQSYQRTAVVLDHFDYEINTRLGGVTTADGEQRNVRVMLLAGSDLIATMSEPGVWSEPDVCQFSPFPIPNPHQCFPTYPILKMTHSLTSHTVHVMVLYYLYFSSIISLDVMVFSSSKEPAPMWTKP